LNALLTFPVPLLHRPQQDILSTLVNTTHVSWDTDGTDDLTLFSREVPEPVSLLYSFVVKLLTTVMVLGLPLPVGSIAPTFVIGALIGRLFGYVCHPLCAAGVLTCFDETMVEGDAREIFIAKFALVGACAFCAGCFRSFAQVIVVFELTGLTSMLLPLCSASLVAIFTANTLGVNFFDSAIQLKSLPHLPSLAQGRGQHRVCDLMTREVPVLPPQVSSDELEAIRELFSEWQYEVPIVLRTEWEGSRSHMQRLQEDQLALLSAVPTMPPAQPENTVLDLWREGVVVPLQVPDQMLLKDLLPLFRHMDKSVAFVTKNGHLVGAVTLADLYKRAVSRQAPNARGVIGKSVGERVLASFHGRRTSA